jgi:hypothetical protein
MNCAECVRLVAVADVRSLADRPEVMRHCIECGDCAALVQSISRETEEMASLYDAIPSEADPYLVARRATAEAGLRRRRRLWQLRAVTAAVFLLFASIFWMRSRAVVPIEHMQDMRTFELRCLDEHQAAALIGPMLERSGAEMLPPVAGVRAITVRANEQDLERVEQLLVRFDNARVTSTNPSCSWREPTIGTTAPTQPTPSADAPALPGQPAHVPRGPTPAPTPTPPQAQQRP